MTPRDLRHARDEIGIRTAIDLRSSHERAREPAAALCAPPVREYHLPLFDRERSSSAPALPLDEIYAALLGLAREPIGRAVRVLAQVHEPVVFYCAAGKDRTGLLAAVLLAALGVREEDVIEDYAATRSSLERILDRLRGSSSYDYVFAELPPETLHAEPQTMERLLRHVTREYGSMQAYVLGCGISPAELAALAETVLEDD
jgi:protein-tyrosine phosphatase